jgi:hypothetical protein
MAIQLLLKVNKTVFEHTVKQLIQRNGLKVGYSYTSDDYYISGDERIINQIQQELAVS